jgi:hypothetical protein
MSLFDNYQNDKTLSISKQVDLYYTLLNQILDAKKKKDFHQMLSYCDLSFPLIPALIKKTKVECDGKFLIKSIPAIELGLIFWAIYEDKSKIQKIQELVNKFPDLEPWIQNVDDAFNSFEMTGQILQLLEKNSILKQTDIKKMIPEADGKKIANLVYYLSLLGRIERDKAGNSYNLKLKSKVSFLKILTKILK